MPSYALARGIMFFSLDKPALLIYYSLANIKLPSSFSQTYQFMLALLGHALLGVIVLITIEVIKYIRLRLAV